MAQTKQQILEAALGLPEEEREELADRLMESIGYDGPDDEAFAAELERRMREFDEDPNVGVTWEEVQKSLRNPETP